MSDTKRPEGTEPTVAAPISGAEPTMAAPGGGVSATVATATPSQPPSGARAQPRSRAPSSGSTLRKVGAEIASASIHRFGSVGRDRFEVLDELARGGLGRVFRARDPRTGRILAIKEVLHPVPEIVARFAREALVTANLQHPSIVPVYEVGTWGEGEPFYAMKLVAGRTLDRVIAEATTIDERVALVPHVIAIADALAYAHSEHVIHRDLKPSNVIIGSYGETVVIDWGLAKNLASDEPEEDIAESSTIPPDSQETVAGSVLGTPAYMPPEQARGERLDEHADVYAIGAILYHMLTGKRPFAEVSDISDLIESVALRAPVPILELAPAAPAELVAIVEKAMAREASSRYPTAEGLAGDLRRYQAGKLVGAHRYSRVQLVRRWIARHAAAVAVASAALLVLAVTGVVAVRRITSERDEARRQGAIARVQQAEAEAANAEAKRRLSDTLEELARQALINEQPDHAVPLLAASAATRATQTPTASLLAAHARAAYTGLVAVVPPTASLIKQGALTAGGTHVVLADRDAKVTAWDIAARKTAWSVDAGDSISMSPQGDRFLASPGDGTLTLRSVDDGRVLESWSPGAHRRPLISTWSFDGSRFAFVGDEGHILIGTPGQSALVDVVVGNSAVTATAFSPDGTRIVSGDDDGKLTLCDARTGTITTKLADAKDAISQVSWLDNDRFVAGDDAGTVRLWHAGRQVVQRRFELGQAIYALQVGGDGTWLAASGDGVIVKVWTIATGELRAELAEHRLGVSLLATVGDWLVTGDDVGAVRVWDPRTGERAHLFPSAEELNTFDVRDGLLLATSNGRQRVWRLAPNTVVRRVHAHEARVRGLAFGSDGTLYTASLDGTGAAIDVAHGTFRRLGTSDGFSELPGRTFAEAAKNARANPHGVRSMALSPDGRVAAYALEDGRIELFDATGTAIATWRGHTGRVRRVIFASDGKTAYSVGDTTLRVWDVASGVERSKVTIAGAGWDVAMLNDTTVVTLAEDPPAVQLWRTADLVELPRTPRIKSMLPALGVVGGRLLVADRESVTLHDSSGDTLHSIPLFLAFSFDANDAGELAIGSGIGRIALYDAETLAPIRDLHVGNSVVTGVAFRPDGKVLAAISENRVLLFDPAAGRLLAALPVLPVVLGTLAWSRDGRYLAVAGSSGTVWVWDVAPADAHELEAFGACVSPWRLDDTTLVKKPFAPESCSILARP